MTDNFIGKKAFEIAFAVYRVAARVNNQPMKSELENEAIKMYVGDFTSESLKRAIELGEAIGEISTLNASVLYREIGKLSAFIDQIKGVDVDIESIFSRTEPLPTNKQVSSQRARVIRKESESKDVKSGNAAISGVSSSSSERQAKLEEKIRQYGNTAMKDLIAAFSDVSERTLRYDLQKMCDRGIIERIGSGGPGVYYKIVLSA